MRLEAEHHAPEGAVEQFVLVETAGCLGHGRKGDVGAQNGVARNAVGSSTQGTGTRLVEHVANHLRHVLMAATQLVGHLHLRQVVVLRASAQILQSDGVFQECRLGGVGRWKPDGYRGLDGLVLAVALRVVDFRPLSQLLEFRLVVHEEVLADSLSKVGQLTLVTARIAHQLGHHAASFLPAAVGILKFCATDVRAKCGKEHGNQRFVHVFRGLREQ